MQVPAKQSTKEPETAMYASRIASPKDLVASRPIAGEGRNDPGAPAGFCVTINCAAKYPLVEPQGAVQAGMT
jgi:hypothetical protein